MEEVEKVTISIPHQNSRDYFFDQCKEVHKIFLENSKFFREDFKTIKRQYNELSAKTAKLMDKISRYLVDIKKENLENKELFKKIVSTNQTVEQTLCQVFLAIRQNEYLQAWYPEQAPKPPKAANG